MTLESIKFTALVFVTSACIWIVGCMLSCDADECKSETSTASYRFQSQGRIPFNEGKRAEIYRDTHTDILYLYVYDGDSNGVGPAITRLWEKEEKK